MKKALVYVKEWNGRQVGDIERITQEEPKIFLLSDGICTTVDVPENVDENYAQTTWVETVAAFWSRSGFADQASEPTFAVDTWYKEGESDLTSAPIAYWSRTDFTNKVVEPVFAVDTWYKNGEEDVTVDPADETWTFGAQGTVDPRWTAHVDQTWTFGAQGTVDPRWTMTPEVPAHWEIIENTAAKTAAIKASEVQAAYDQMNADVLSQMAAIFGTTRADSATAYNETWKEMAANPSDWSSAGLKALFAVAGFAVGDALDTDLKITDYANAKLAEVKAYAIWRMQRIEQFRVERDTIMGGNNENHTA